MTLELPDGDLLRLLRAGDEEAFAALYRRWRLPIYRLTLALSGSREVADDATQETFLALLSDAERYDPERGPLGAYLRGIARHQVLRRFRTEKRYAPLPEEAETAMAGTGETQMIEGLSRDHDAHAVQRAVASLPPHYREAVALCDLSGLEYAEAAAILGLPVGTVRSRLARARGLVARKLARPEPARSGWRRLLWGWSL